MAWRLGNGKLRKDQTDHYGRVKRGGGGGASIDDFENSSSIDFSLNPTTEKIKATVDEDILEKVDNSLQLPEEAPTSNILLGLDTIKEQTNVTIGSGLSLQNNVLTATGGGGGGATIDDFVDSESVSFSVDETTSKIKAEVDDEVLGKVDNSLQLPSTTPLNNTIVGINTSKEQVPITVGSGLNLSNNVLTATGGGGGLTPEDFQDSDEIIFDVDEDTDKMYAVLDNDVSNKINNSLQVPLTTPTAMELVGIDTDKSQSRIGIGAGLTVENNQLKVTGGGSSVPFPDYSRKLLEKNVSVSSETLKAQDIYTATEDCYVLYNISSEDATKKVKECSIALGEYNPETEVFSKPIIISRRYINYGDSNYIDHYFVCGTYLKAGKSIQLNVEYLQKPSFTHSCGYVVYGII